MAAIALPPYNTLKNNIVDILNAVSTLEVTANNPGFIAERDRYRNWDYTETLKARVNVMIQNMTPSGGGSQIHTDYRTTVNVDMYVIGGATQEETGEVEGEEVTILTPANIVAAVFDDYRPSPPAVEFRRAAHVVYSPLILIYS